MSKIVVNAIKENLDRLVKNKDFVASRVDEEPISVGDLLVINNSFLHRQKTKNKKNDKYLALEITGKKPADFAPLIAIPRSKINKELKKYHSTAKDIAAFPIDDIIQEQLSELGTLVFVLIGELDESTDPEVNLSTAKFKRLRWSSSQGKTLVIEKDTIRINDPNNFDAIWAEFSKHCQTAKIELPENFHDTFETAITNLKKDAVVYLEITPNSKAVAENTIIEKALNTLRNERKSYSSALKHWAENKFSDDVSYERLLKISYNFASDAIRLLRLIVNICDLKPIVLWGTIAEHYALSKAFQNLNISSTKKALLDHYRDTIADARNHTFHNLFLFQKSIEVILPTGAIKNPRLRIFSEYSSRQTNNKMMFEDQAIAEILLQFTRSHLRYVPDTFWQQNLAVIDATIDLFEQTSSFLNILIRTKSTSR